MHDIAPHVGTRLSCIISSRLRVALRVPVRKKILRKKCSLMISLSSSIDHVAHLDTLDML